MTNGFPGNVQGVPAVQLAPAPQNAYFQGARQPQQNVNPTYNATAGMITGCVQIGCGVVALILGIISLAITTALANVGTGIWSGIAFFIVSGILGVASAKRMSCVIISYMVMSILCSVVAGLGIIIYSADASNRYYYYYDYYYYDWDLGDPDTILAIDILAIVVSIAELVTSITAAAFCCCRNCCPSTDPAAFNYQTLGGDAMPQGMGAFATTTTQHTMGPQAPGAPSVSAQPMQWQPMSGQQPTAPQESTNPTWVQADQPPQTVTGVEKPLPTSRSGRVAYTSSRSMDTRG